MKHGRRVISDSEGAVAGGRSQGWFFWGLVWFQFIWDSASSRPAAVEDPKSITKLFARVDTLGYPSRLVSSVCGQPAGDVGELSPQPSCSPGTSGLQLARRRVPRSRGTGQAGNQGFVQWRFDEGSFECIRPMQGTGSHFYWWPWQYVLRYLPMSWIFDSAWPLAWGWYPDVRLRWCLADWRTISRLWIWIGGPSPHDILWKTIIPEYLVEEGFGCFKGVGSRGRDINLQDLDKRSTTTSTQVKVSDRRRSEIKSSAMYDLGWCGIGKGSSLPSGSHWGTFEMAQTEHPFMNQERSWDMLGHQYRGAKSERVHWLLGVQIPEQIVLNPWG